MMTHMARNPLFSTYRAGENRVTSSLIAVFERIDPRLVEQILAAATGESTISLLSFANQVVAQHDGGTVPDASISANFRYLFEVKTTTNAVRKDQLVGHLQQLTGTHADEKLVVLTPDPAAPSALGDLADSRLLWASFAALTEAIDLVLADPTELIGEQTRFLLRELQALFHADGLVDVTDVVVVAARAAYPEYLQHSAYVCQPGRSFMKGLTHMGFYADSEIKPEIARIRYVEDNVVFTRDNADRRSTSEDAGLVQVGRLIRKMLDLELRTDGEAYQVFLLSSAADDETVQLPQPIKNTAVSASGKNWAWTLGQRYTRLSALRTGPTDTTALAAADG